VTIPSTVDRATLAQAVAAGVLAVPGVARLSGGRGVEAATLYPGGKVVGVVADDQAVRVHLVAGRLPLGPLIQEIRAAVTIVLVALGAARGVDLVIEDLELDQLPSGVPGTMATIAAHPAVPPSAGRRQPV
jgi:hypothetical protein